MNELSHSDQMIAVANREIELDGLRNQLVSTEEYLKYQDNVSAKLIEQSVKQGKEVLPIVQEHLKSLRKADISQLNKAYVVKYNKELNTTERIPIVDVIGKKYEETISFITKLLQSQYDYTRRNPKKYKNIPELLLQEPPIDVEDLNEECIVYLRSNMRPIDKNLYAKQERWYAKFEKDILSWDVHVPSARGGVTKMATFHRLDEQGNEYTVIEKITVDKVMPYHVVKFQLEKLLLSVTHVEWCIPEPKVDEHIAIPTVEPIKEHTESIPVEVKQQGKPRKPKIWDGTYTHKYQPDSDHPWYMEKKNNKYVWDVQRGRDGKMFAPIVIAGQPEVYKSSVPFGRPKGVAIQHIVLKDEVGNPIIVNNTVKTRVIDHSTPLEQVYEGIPFSKWILLSKSNHTLTTKTPRHIKNAMRDAARDKYVHN